MLSLKYCKICDNIHYAKDCPPKWTLFNDDNPDELFIIYAFTPEEAAFRWAEKEGSDFCDPSYVTIFSSDNEYFKFCVRSISSFDIQRV